MEKRFFWLKLRETFFNETYIKAMRTFKNGDSLVLTYLEMALYSLKSKAPPHKSHRLENVNE